MLSSHGIVKFVACLVFKMGHFLLYYSLGTLLLLNVNGFMGNDFVVKFVVILERMLNLPLFVFLATMGLIQSFFSKTILTALGTKSFSKGLCRTLCLLAIKWKKQTELKE